MTTRPKTCSASVDFSVRCTAPSVGLSNLAAEALSRLRHATCAADLSDDAQRALGKPVASALAYALIEPDDDSADLMIEDLLDAGLSVEDVCLDHLAPAARRLGEWWENDRLPFTEVALATARIQAMLRRMPASRSTACVKDKGAVFCAVPGEQHTLGVMMAADLFRRNGWDVALFVGLTHDELLARLLRDDRPVIGLSCSGEHSRPALARLMGSLRKRRGDARLLLAGQIVKDAERMAKVPAPDAIVTDMASAEAEMRRIEALLSAPRVAHLAAGGRQPAA